MQLLILWWQFCVLLFLWEHCKNTGIIGFRLHLVCHICTMCTINCTMRSPCSAFQLTTTRSRFKIFYNSTYIYSHLQPQCNQNAIFCKQCLHKAKCNRNDVSCAMFMDSLTTVFWCNQENLKMFHESLGKLDGHNEPDAQKIKHIHVLKHILYHVLHIGKTSQWSEYAASLWI